MSDAINGKEHNEQRPLTPYEKQQAMVEFAKNSRAHGEMSWEVEYEGKTLLVEDVSDCDSFQRNALRTSAHKLIDTENNIWVFVRSY